MMVVSTKMTRPGVPTDINFVCRVNLYRAMIFSLIVHYNWSDIQ